MSKLLGVTLIAYILAVGFPAHARDYVGDLVLMSDADVQSAADIASITGNLIVISSSVSNLVLPALRALGGCADIRFNLVLQTVEFPLLESIGGTIFPNSPSPGPIALRVQNNPLLRWLDLSQFVYSGGEISFVGNNSLRKIVLPLLETNDGGLIFSGNQSLKSISAPVLQFIGQSPDISGRGQISQRGLILSANPSLLYFDVDHVATILGSLIIEGNAVLPYASFGALKDVDGPDSFSGPLGEPNGSIPDPAISIAGNANLISFNFLCLVRAKSGVSVKNNLSLKYIGLKQLEKTAGIVAFSDNPLVQYLHLPQLLEAGELRVMNNARLTYLNVRMLTTLRGILYGFEIVDSMFVEVGVVSLTIRNNDALKNIDIPNLAYVTGDIRIINNPKYPTCKAHRIVDALDIFDGSAIITSNSDAAVCGVKRI